MCIHSRPPEEWALRTAGNQVRFRKHLIEIWALGRREGTHRLKKLAFYSEKIIFFSFISLLPMPWTCIPPALWDCVLKRNWHKGSVPHLFFLAVSALHWRAGLGWSSLCTWSLYGLYLLEKFAPLAGYREGLQLRQTWDFILSKIFIGFLSFTLQKGQTDLFPNAWSFLLLFIFQIHFV